jgi:hypothetical protein
LPHVQQPTACRDDAGAVGPWSPPVSPLPLSVCVDADGVERPYLQTPRQETPE